MIWRDLNKNESDGFHYFLLMIYIFLQSDWLWQEFYWVENSKFKDDDYKKIKRYYEHYKLCHKNWIPYEIVLHLEGLACELPYPDLI